MADREKDIRKFRRAAEQRLAAASFLLEHGFHLDAIYLAGYAVECSLKYLILKRGSRAQHAVMYRRLTRVGARGHSFEYLRHVLAGPPINCSLPGAGPLAESFGLVTSWSTDLRYEVGAVDWESANSMLRAARTIREWSIRS